MAYNSHQGNNPRTNKSKRRIDDESALPANHDQNRRRDGTKPMAVENERYGGEIGPISPSPQSSTFSRMHPLQPGSSSSSLTLENRVKHVAQQHDSSFPPEEYTTHVEKHTVTSSFHGAHNFSISGNPHFNNIGKQKNVNYYGGVHGLDVLKEFVSFSALHDSSAQDPERRCHPGTRKNVLEQMSNWIDNQETTERILWLYGPAGAGKSAIAQTLSHLYDRDKVAATFFFFRSDPDRSDGNRLFPTLAWQLAISMPKIREYLASFLNENPDLPRKTAEIQFEHLITRPLQALIATIEMQTMPVVVIDGIDECSDQTLQRRLLNILGNAVVEDRFPLRFLISCRPEAHIRDTFYTFPRSTLTIDLANINDSYLGIQKYLQDEFSRIATEQKINPWTWPGLLVIEDLVSKSSGQFIYASTIIKFVSDEYSSAPSQLDIIRGLKPSKGKSPFEELDALYIEVLQRQPDQDFMKDFLSVLVAFLEIPESPYSWDSPPPIGDDVAYLLDVDAGELYRKLRGMHSLLKFGPSNPVFSLYHQSFLDFLTESSRSCQYHNSKHSATKRYLELFTSVLVKYAPRVIKEHDYHNLEARHFFPTFGRAMMNYQVWIRLPIEDWEETLQPLRSLKDELLKLPNSSPPWRRDFCNECAIFYVIDDLLLRLSIMHARSNVKLSSPQDRLQGLDPLPGCLTYIADNIPGAGDLQLGEWKDHDGASSLIRTYEMRSIPKDLDGCLDLLLSRLRSIKSEQSISMSTIKLFQVLLGYDHSETASRVRTASDAQCLVDVICHFTNDKTIYNCYDMNTRCNATRLALEIYARVPLLPQFLFLRTGLDLDQELIMADGSGADDSVADDSDWLLGRHQGKAILIKRIAWDGMNALCQTVFLSRVLSHENLCSFLGVYEPELYRGIFAVFQCTENGTLRDWRRTINPSVIQMQEHVRMLEVAKAIQYLHLSGVILGYQIKSDTIFMDSNHHAIVVPYCTRPEPYLDEAPPSRALSVSLREIQSDVFWFGCLFYEVYFNTYVGRDDTYENFKKELTLRCLLEPEIHDQTCQLIQRCCTQDPKNRPTMDEVVAEIESWG